MDKQFGNFVSLLIKALYLVGIMAPLCFFLLVRSTQAFAAQSFFEDNQGKKTRKFIATRDFSRLAENNSTALPFLAWEQVDKGLFIGKANLPESQSLQGETFFIAVRVDPSLYHFSLHMASETGKSYSLSEWAKQNKLLVAVNASMYLRDKITSTGYMRQKTHVNNPKIGSRLGAFFVASPKKTGLPQADILEADATLGAKLTKEYDLVVQNYRFLDRNGKLLWPASEEQHSIAVVGKDKKGNILFILCQQPLTPRRFAEYLLRFVPDISTVMYVEGGRQAGLFIDLASGQEKTQAAVLQEQVTFKGRQSLLYTMGSPYDSLPNVLGVSRKE